MTISGAICTKIWSLYLLDVTVDVDLGDEAVTVDVLLSKKEIEALNETVLFHFFYSVELSLFLR